MRSIFFVLKGTDGVRVRAYGRSGAGHKVVKSKLLCETDYHDTIYATTTRFQVAKKVGWPRGCCWWAGRSGRWVWMGGCILFLNALLKKRAQGFIHVNLIKKMQHSCHGSKKNGSTPYLDRARLSPSITSTSTRSCGRVVWRQTKCLRLVLFFAGAYPPKAPTSQGGRCTRIPRPRVQLCRF